LFIASACLWFALLVAVCWLFDVCWWLPAGGFLLLAVCCLLLIPLLPQLESKEIRDAGARSSLATRQRSCGLRMKLRLALVI